MQLTKWRKHHGISLLSAAKLFGLSTKSFGHVKRIEDGDGWVGADLAERIFLVTSDLGPEPVTVEDHLEAWRRFHRAELRTLRADTRSALRAHRKRGRELKEGINGEI